MITRTSALLNPKIGGDELNDNRARVLIKLCKSKMSIDDIALVLNCSESVVRSLLVRPFRLFGTDGKNYVAAIGPNTLEVLPLSKRAGAIDMHPVSDEVIAQEREKLAQHLAMQIRRWLESFAASDADCQLAIERAGLLLDESSFYRRDKPAWVSMEVVRAWKPHFSCIEDREFRNVVGRWLAAWVRFWIVDPEIWNRALDLEFAHFGANAWSGCTYNAG